METWERRTTMAKICTECGLKHYSTARRCVKCGSKLKIIKKDQIRNIIIIMLSIAIVTSLAIAIIVPIMQSPETKLKRIMNYIIDNDSRAVFDSYPHFYIAHLEEEDPFYAIPLRERIKQLSDYIFSFNVHEIVKPSTSQRTDILKQISECADYGYDPAQLEDMRVIWLEIRGGIRGLWYTTYEKFVMIKYNDEWCLWPAKSILEPTPNVVVPR